RGDPTATARPTRTCKSYQLVMTTGSLCMSDGTAEPPNTHSSGQSGWIRDPPESGHGVMSRHATASGSIDNGDAGDPFLRLGERPIGDEHLTPTNGEGVLNTLETVASDARDPLSHVVALIGHPSLGFGVDAHEHQVPHWTSSSVRSHRAARFSVARSIFFIPRMAFITRSAFPP